jgi:phage gpG-like protein
MITLDTQGLEPVIDRLDGVAQRIRTELRQTIRDLAETLVARIRSGPLDGGVLQRRSGALAASVGARIVEDGSRIGAAIGADAAYAQFHELGFDGTEGVRAHLTHIRQAFGRPIPSRTVAVRAHTRQVHYPAHPFLRPSLAEASAGIEAALLDAASRGLA